VSKLEVKEKVASVSCLLVALSILVLSIFEPGNITSIADSFNFVGAFLCFIYLGLSPQIFYLPFKSAMAGNGNVLFLSKINHTRIGFTMFLCFVAGTICRVLL
jgi:hypothetical protein